MRGEKIFSILDSLEEGVNIFSNLLTVFLTTYKGSNPKEKYRKLRILERDRIKNSINRRERNKLLNLLYKMNKEGLIERSGLKYLITKKGKEKYLYLKNSLLFQKKFNKEGEDELKIIAFDIPEKLRIYRRWLRSILISLDFKMLQKSLFIGKQKLPEDFIKELKRLSILHYVEIFAITKKGTLEKYLS